MKPIAIFYHVYLGGGVDNALRVVSEQLYSIRKSGLESVAYRILIGVSGTQSDYLAVTSMCPQSSNVVHNLEGVGELPTMKLMQEHCQLGCDDFICYLHTKGVSHGSDDHSERWRLSMEGVVIWEWRRCVHLLEIGFEGVGAHWRRPEKVPRHGAYPYWAGNFWWSQSKYLKTLPVIDVTGNRFEAEAWFGKSRRVAHVKDLAKDVFP